MSRMSSVGPHARAAQIGVTLATATLIAGCFEGGSSCDGGSWFIDGFSADAQLQLYAVSAGACSQPWCVDGGLDCSGTFAPSQGSCTLFVAAAGVGTCITTIEFPGRDNVVNVHA